jgi:hypothetical protein
MNIVESYVDFVPTLNYRRLVERLLLTVPEKYLTGLGPIVLSNHTGIPRREKRGTIRWKNRRMNRTDIAGRYHPAIRGQKAWIQLFVDHIDMPPCFLRWISPLSELALGSVFYHELGHHAHTLRPEFHDKENVADSWCGRFIINHIKKAYWYLYPVLKLFTIIMRLIRGRRLQPAR